MRIPPVPPEVIWAEPVHRQVRLRHWVRGTLLGVAAGLVVVFAIACWLDPYNPDGTPLRMGTHRKLHLPPCTFYDATGVPCPSCGMTTSFALLMHGDPIASLRANAAGTLLATGCLLFIPWSLISAARGRPLFLRSLERTLTRCVVALVVVMFLRWVIVIGLWWWSGWPPGPASP